MGMELDTKNLKLQKITNYIDKLSLFIDLLALKIREIIKAILEVTEVLLYMLIAVVSFGFLYILLNCTSNSNFLPESIIISYFKLFKLITISCVVFVFLIKFLKNEYQK